MSWPDAIDVTSMPPIIGIISNPDPVGLTPFTTCRKSGKYVTEPNSANPTMDLLKKLADYYKVTVEYLALPEAVTNESSAEAKAFFRKFQRLSEEERNIILRTMEALDRTKAKQ